MSTYRSGWRANAKRRRIAPPALLLVRLSFLQVTGELHADDARVADEAGQIVEVDATLEVRLVRQVAGVERDFHRLVGNTYDPKTAFVLPQWNSCDL